MDSLLGITFPIDNPIAVFLTVLLIILLAPMLMRRLHIPHIVGMILAGLLLGPYALNVLPFDRSIDVFGKVGLYYIMFLAGLEIDIRDLRKNLGRSLVFGLVTFSLPALLGLASSLWLLHFSLMSAVLLMSVFASHTLVSFPIISRYGLSNRSAVNIAVGGTVVAVTLAMFLLAGVDCHFQDNESKDRWLGMVLELAAALGIIFYVLPRLCRWFLNHYTDGVLRFVMVLAMAFFGALLTEIAGFQGILGAFFVGLALNAQIPKLSSLMNRISFVGNALFFPYFLISVGMMINLRSFVQSWDGVFVAVVMTTVVLAGKWMAAKFSQWLFKMRDSEGTLLFGLTAGRAAVTLAVVAVGYHIIVGYQDDGTPVRLLGESVLNGSVVMILVCCLVSPVVTERAARRMMLEKDEKEVARQDAAHILIPVSNPKMIENLVQIAAFSRNPQDELYALSVVEDDTGADRKQCSNLLNMSAQYAASMETDFHQIMRFDSDVTAGIKQAVREYAISDVILYMSHFATTADTPFSSRLNRLIGQVHTNLYIFRYKSRPASWRSVVLFLPERSEYEHGFGSLIRRCSLLCRNLGCPLVLYGHPATIQHVRQLKTGQFPDLSVEYNDWHNWQNIPMLVDNLSTDSLLMFVLSRQDGVSYDASLENIPSMIASIFQDRTVAFVFPEQRLYTQNMTSYSGPIELKSTKRDK